MSDILKGIAEYLSPFVPMTNYIDEYIQYLQGEYLNGRWVPDRSIYHGPAVEILYVDKIIDGHPIFEVGVIIQHIEGSSSVWVERNTISGLRYGNLYVDPADPNSLEMIKAFVVEEVTDNA